MDATVTEPPADRAGRTTALLTYILSYEDLLARVSASFRIRGPFIFGRAADEKSPGFRDDGAFRLPDRWMSGEHARLERAPGGDYILRDLGSRNGTYVDGERVVEKRLADGALIEVGHSLLSFRLVPEAAAAALDRPEKERRLGATVSFSPDVAQLLGELERLAPTPQPILILAETGAGKESLAEEIHRLSGRTGELCPVDCGAVPESLFEATFFGHKRGAFTGAVENRVGEIARADGGTLFLDEVGNLPLASQAKLLRVIEDGQVTALGAAQARTVDVRWVAATNRDLFADPTGFRDDLLRRLAGYVARLPPLRRRREDLGVLSAALLAAAGVSRASIAVPAARALFAGALPGNVRQLRAALTSAALLAQGSPITVEHLPVEPPPSDEEVGEKAGPPEAAAIEAALAATGGNVVQAAKRLGTHARQVYRWIDRFAIPLDKYRV